MTRKVFFSFHYEDVKSFRANVVRNSWRIGYNTASPFLDGSLWEDAKLKGDAALKNLIENTGLKNTSATIVLIGSETHDRRWVKYEILKSFERGNGILGVYVNRIKDRLGSTCAKGLNPFDRLKFHVFEDGKKIYFYELNNRVWRLNPDLPVINNKKSNTIYFPPNLWGKQFQLG